MLSPSPPSSLQRSSAMRVVSSAPLGFSNPLQREERYPSSYSMEQQVPGSPVLPTTHFLEHIGGRAPRTLLAMRSDTLDSLSSYLMTSTDGYHIRSCFGCLIDTLLCSICKDHLLHVELTGSSSQATVPLVPGIHDWMMCQHLCVGSTW